METEGAGIILRSSFGEHISKFKGYNFPPDSDKRNFLLAQLVKLIRAEQKNGPP
jgi:hypothetical protein